MRVKRSLAAVALALTLALGCSSWADEPAPLNLPLGDGIDSMLHLRWVRPEELAEGYAALLPNNRGVSLRVEVDDRVREQFPNLQADESLDEYEWRLSTGEGRLWPRLDGSRCRFLPQVSTDEPIVIIVRLTRTYTDRRRGQPDRTATTSLMGRIIAPISGEHLDGAGFLRGFEIGVYPDVHNPQLFEELGPGYEWVQANPDRYATPDWFYPVTRESLDWPISEHLRLGEFILHRPWFSLGMPQWFALDLGLISKMEDLAALMHDAGYEFDHFTLIYGYRSPSYNLGRIERDNEETLKSPFSQHMYGRAADFIIDTDGDLRLDDLDGDGDVDVRDAGIILHFVNVLDRRYRNLGDPRVGGAGVYDHNDFFERPVQSPYAHLDVRGFLRDNGTLYRWPGTWHDTREPINWGAMTLEDFVTPVPVSREP